MKNRILFMAGLLLATSLTACTYGVRHGSDESQAAGTTYLTRQTVKDEKAIGGTFRLILYGGNYSDDKETIAVLDREGDGYIFEPYAPDFSYSIKENIPSERALEEAKGFVKGHASFINLLITKLVDNEGKTLGYEVRPLYFPLRYGLSDILDVYYTRKGKKVTIYIYLKSSVRRHFDSDDDSNGGGFIK